MDSINNKTEDKKISITLPQIVEFKLSKEEIKKAFLTLKEKGFEEKVIKMIIKETEDYVCLGCGCTDTYACDCGCYWLGVDPDSGFGVCSSCEEHTKEILEKKGETNE